MASTSLEAVAQGNANFSRNFLKVRFVKGRCRCRKVLDLQLFFSISNFKKNDLLLTLESFTCLSNKNLKMGSIREVSL
jgi:hypothetical protein